MNINNPRTHPKTGYYNTIHWSNGPYLIFYDIKDDNTFYIDFDKKFTINSPFNDIQLKTTQFNKCDHNYLFIALMWIGKTL